MIKRILIPLLAIAGIGFSIFMIYYGKRKPPVGVVLFPPPTVPYQHFIAAEGIIESVDKNIEIAATFNDLITDVYVSVGQYVKKGTPLFKTDTRQFDVQLEKALQELAFAQVEYEERVKDFSFYERLDEKSAVSEQSYITALFNKELAQERVQIAQAAIDVIKMSQERAITRAPLDGRVLQSNVRPGAYANVNPFDQVPLMLFGDVSVYHLRIDIDEEDAWRFVPGSSAKAFLRGNAQVSMPLEYVYTEPYLIPKRSLTGANTERVDTRVLQVVYTFSVDSYPIYVGQLVDVYLEAQPHGAAT